MTREDAIEMVRDAFDVWQSEYETVSRNDWSEEHEARDMAIKALEQEPCKDIMTIHTQGLDEGIRCAMCTNSMKSDRGCDGGCVVNEAMYKEVMNTIRNHIVPLVTPTKCIATVKFSKEDMQELVNEKIKEIVYELKKGDK